MAPPADRGGHENDIYKIVRHLKTDEVRINASCLENNQDNAERGET